MIEKYFMRWKTFQEENFDAKNLKSFSRKQLKN